MTEYAIGTRFKTRGKHPRLCIVIDILKTYDHQGRHVRTRYVATHDLVGRVVHDYDVVAATIAMGIIKD